MREISLEPVVTLNTWRLLQLNTHDAMMNMAVDEAILTAKIADDYPNTLRFYRWKPSAVSIGKFQRVENEVQLENCKKLGVDVVRRMTGGGTVYHDAEDEITYSVVAGKEDLKAKDITAVYASIYAGLTEALKILRLTTDFSEGNAKTCPNLTINGKKISGSAQCHKAGVVLQHGTVLVKVNLERMFTFLRVPWAKTCMQVMDVAKKRITSIGDELGKDVSVSEVNSALVEGFSRALNIELTVGELTSFELELAERLCKEKYHRDEWNFRGEDSRNSGHREKRS
jgi:lipoate-protein ligase A